MPLNYGQLLEIPGGPGDVGAIIGGSGVNITATGVMNTVEYLLDKIVAGSNVTVTPGSGVGDVVITSTVPGPGDLPSGTTMLFHQAAAPTNWVKKTDRNDYMVRVVSGGTGGGEGGSIPFSTVFQNFTPTGSTSFQVDLAGTTSNANVVASGGVNFQGQVTVTSIDANRNPGHQHNISQCVRDGYGGQQSWDQGGTTNLFGSTTGTSQGGNQSHTHGLSGSLGFTGSNNNHQHGFSASASTGNLNINGTPMQLNVQYLDCIVCTKS